MPRLAAGRPWVSVPVGTVAVGWGWTRWYPPVRRPAEARHHSSPREGRIPANGVSEVGHTLSRDGMSIMSVGIRFVRTGSSKRGGTVPGLFLSHCRCISVLPHIRSVETGHGNTGIVGCCSRETRRQCVGVVIWFPELPAATSGPTRNHKQSSQKTGDVNIFRSVRLLNNEHRSDFPWTVLCLGVDSLRNLDTLWNVDSMWNVDSRWNVDRTPDGV